MPGSKSRATSINSNLLRGIPYKIEAVYKKEENPLTRKVRKSLKTANFEIKNV